MPFSNNLTNKCVYFLAEGVGRQALPLRVPPGQQRGQQRHRSEETDPRPVPAAHGQVLDLQHASSRERTYQAQDFLARRQRQGLTTGRPPLLGPLIYYTYIRTHTHAHLITLSINETAVFLYRSSQWLLVPAASQLQTHEISLTNIYIE
jgi:hypothetical protein